MGPAAPEAVGDHAAFGSTGEERQDVKELLAAEYTLLATLLSTTWAATLTRTSIFLFTLSAAGVTLGFAAQGGVERGLFRGLALVVLPIVLFLGITTFVRLVQLQREQYVYLAGLNRIRRFMVDHAPAARQYLVLPLHDDYRGVFRGPGTGMGTRPPRFRLVNLIAQTQGIVCVVTAAVAAAFAGLAAAPLGFLPLSAIAAVAFLATSVLLLVYWQRSLADVIEATVPVYPTPPG
jgi:hypothetical protein